MEARISSIPCCSTSCCSCCCFPSKLLVNYRNHERTHDHVLHSGCGVDWPRCRPPRENVSDNLIRSAARGTESWGRQSLARINCSVTGRERSQPSLHARAFLDGPDLPSSARAAQPEPDYLSNATAPVLAVVHFRRRKRGGEPYFLYQICDILATMPSGGYWLGC